MTRSSGRARSVAAFRKSRRSKSSFATASPPVARSGIRTPLDHIAFAAPRPSLRKQLRHQAPRQHAGDAAAIVAGGERRLHRPHPLPPHLLAPLHPPPPHPPPPP